MTIEPHPAYARACHFSPPGVAVEPVVVDCHSHVFNAEDLPIDGFVKRRLTPLPSVLTGVLSLPLDRLTAWAAPGSKEAERLAALIAARTGGLEGLAEVPEAESGQELISDEELDARLVSMWPLAEQPAGGVLEGVPADTETLLADRLAGATPEQLDELRAWLEDADDAPAGVAPPPAPGDEGLEGISDLFGLARSVKDAVHRYVAALRLVTRHRYLVAAEVAATYPSARLFVPALVDFDRTARDRPSTPVANQVTIHSLVSKLSVAGGIPGAPEVRIHPLVAFCPYREIECSELATWDVLDGAPNGYVPYADPAMATDGDRYHDGLVYRRARARRLTVPSGPWSSARLDLDGVTRAIDIVRHAVELGGFAGVKLYPPSGFLPLGNGARFGERVGLKLDAALRALYAYCSAEEVPILTHAARSNGFDKGYDELASPAGWAGVLSEFPELRLCFGHFGHLQGVGDPGKPTATSWPARFLRLIDSYPHVYADVGNSRYAYDDDYRRRFDAFLGWALGGPDSGDPTGRKRRRRIMFGSDYWMNTLGPGHHDALTRFRDGVESAFGARARDDFLGHNALRWLGFRDEDDAVRADGPAVTRLRAFYADHPLPSWLGG
ncbi:amidohydrolase family protein [Phytohabitans sp. LJ34]|uniref:amidohydrolase family protein n=1 Tax=Phytohabitans sp. LJ34 TaxID=3452217 RepID=UPI003F8CBBD0